MSGESGIKRDVEQLEDAMDRLDTAIPPLKRAAPARYLPSMNRLVPFKRPATARRSPGPMNQMGFAVERWMDEMKRRREFVFTTDRYALLYDDRNPITFVSKIQVALCAPQAVDSMVPIAKLRCAMTGILKSRDKVGRQGALQRLFEVYASGQMSDPRVGMEFETVGRTSQWTVQARSFVDGTVVWTLPVTGGPAYAIELSHDDIWDAVTDFGMRNLDTQAADSMELKFYWLPSSVAVFNYLIRESTGDVRWKALVETIRDIYHLFSHHVQAYGFTTYRDVYFPLARTEWNGLWEFIVKCLDERAVFFDKGLYGAAFGSLAGPFIRHCCMRERIPGDRLDAGTPLTSAVLDRCLVWQMSKHNDLFFGVYLHENERVDIGTFTS